MPIKFQSYLKNIDKLDKYLDQPNINNGKTLDFSIKRVAKDIFAAFARIFNYLFGDHNYYSTKNIAAFVQTYSQQHNKKEDEYVKVEKLLQRLNVISLKKKTFGIGIELSPFRKEGENLYFYNQTIPHIDRASECRLDHKNNKIIISIFTKTGTVANIEIVLKDQREYINLIHYLLEKTKIVFIKEGFGIVCNSSTLTLNFKNNDDRNEFIKTFEKYFHIKNEFDINQKDNQLELKLKFGKEDEKRVLGVAEILGNRISSIHGYDSHQCRNFSMNANGISETNSKVTTEEIREYIEKIEIPPPSLLEKTKEIKPETPVMLSEIPKNFSLKIDGKILKVGNVTIPYISRTTKAWMYADSHTIVACIDARRKNYSVKAVIQLQNKEKLKECMLMLLNQTSTTVSTPAIRALKPNNSSISFTFDNWKDAEIFLENFGPYFFSNSEFKYKFDYKTNQLTYSLANENQVLIKEVLTNLNNRISHGRISKLLIENNDSTFPATYYFTPLDIAISLQDAQIKEHTYEVTPSSVRHTYFDDQNRKFYNEATEEDMRNWIERVDENTLAQCFNDFNFWEEIYKEMEKDSDLKPQVEILKKLILKVDIAKFLLKGFSPKETEKENFEEIGKIIKQNKMINLINNLINLKLPEL